jgi:hypothetical protein
MHIEPDQNPILKDKKGTFKHDLTPETEGSSSLCNHTLKATNNLFLKKNMG